MCNRAQCCNVIVWRRFNTLQTVRRTLLGGILSNQHAICMAQAKLSCFHVLLYSISIRFAAASAATGHDETVSFACSWQCVNNSPEATLVCQYLRRQMCRMYYLLEVLTESEGPQSVSQLLDLIVQFDA